MQQLMEIIRRCPAEEQGGGRGEEQGGGRGDQPPESKRRKKTGIRHSRKGRTGEL